VARAAAAAGYTAGAALYEPLMPKSTLSDPMRWPRLVFNRRDSRLRARVKARLFTGSPGLWNLLHGRADR
jgi:hypothetical protein